MTPQDSLQIKYNQKYSLIVFLLVVGDGFKFEVGSHLFTRFPSLWFSGPVWERHLESPPQLYVFLGLVHSARN